MEWYVYHNKYDDNNIIDDNYINDDNYHLCPTF